MIHKTFEELESDNKIQELTYLASHLKPLTKPALY